MTDTTFLELFQTHVSVVEQYGGEVAKDPGVIHSELKLEGIDLAKSTAEQKQTVIKSAKGKYLDVTMLEAAGVTRYRKLNKDLENQYTMGHINYISTIAAAYNLIVNYTESRKNGRPVSTPECGVAFTNVDDASTSTPQYDGDPAWLSKIKYFKCEKKGHFARDFPDKKKDVNGKVVGLMVGNEDIAGSEDKN
jgi:hypothetical protein